MILVANKADLESERVVSKVVAVNKCVGGGAQDVSLILLDTRFLN